jgi:hypothetical protein
MIKPRPSAPYWTVHGMYTMRARDPAVQSIEIKTYPPRSLKKFRSNWYGLYLKLQRIGPWSHIFYELFYDNGHVACISCVIGGYSNVRLDQHGLRSLRADPNVKLVEFVVRQDTWDGDHKRIDEAGLERYLKALPYCKSIEVRLPEDVMRANGVGFHWGTACEVAQGLRSIDADHTRST